LINLDSSDSKIIAKNIMDILNGNKGPVFKENNYGNGSASEKIIEYLILNYININGD